MLSFHSIASQFMYPETISSYLKVPSPLLGRVLTEFYPIQAAGIGSSGLDKPSLISAIQKGFRLIDTAKAYKNEKIVGEAIADSGIPPNDIFVITKLFNPNVENRKALRKAVEDSVAQPGKVPELFLIHGSYPEAPMLALFDELEVMKKENKVQGYGVSNFDLDQLEFLLQHGIKPILNQVEYHPYFQRTELLQFCQKNNIILQAYRPLAEGKALTDHTLNCIAQEHHVSAACILYTWLAQQGIPIVTKVSSDSHQKEYAQSGQIELSAQQMHAIASLNKGEEGRTCKKGGWLVPFTSIMQKQWVSDELRELKRYVDVLNIEGGRIAKQFFKNSNQKWANVGVVLDHPFMTGVDLDQLSKMNQEFQLKEALIHEYDERKVCLAHATILKYYLGQAHRIANKIPSEKVNIIIQVHRGVSSQRPIKQLEKALAICFGDEFEKQACILPNAVSAYNFKAKNLSVEFRYGYRPETIGHYENADIVVSLSILAGLNEQLTSGSLVLPCQFVPMSLKEMVMKKCDCYTVTNHLVDHLDEVLRVQTADLIAAVNRDPLFGSENKTKPQHLAKKLCEIDFSPVTVLQVDGLFNPKQLPSHFSIDFGKSRKSKL